jgi:cobalt-zinc-cadmium efflux system protein
MVLMISSTILVVEVVGAVVSGSLALLADAGHMLTDVAGLILAVAASVLAARPATPERTWGFVRAEVLAAAAQAAVLLAVGVFVLVERVRRLFEPPAVESGAMIVFGVVGLLGNAVSIALLAGGRGENLNTRAAFLEVVNDALGSVAVLVAAAVIALTGFLRADALASLFIGVLILPRTWKLLRETVDVLMDKVPRDLDLADVRNSLLAVAHVHGVHDLHAETFASHLPVVVTLVAQERRRSRSHSSGWAYAAADPRRRGHRSGTGLPRRGRGVDAPGPAAGPGARAGRPSEPCAGDAPDRGRRGA